MRRLAMGCWLWAAACAASGRQVEATPPAPPVHDDPTGPAEAREEPTGTVPFGPEVFRERRARLEAQMKSGVAVVLSAPHVDWESDARQDSDFFWLTGLADEEGAAVVLAPQDRAREYLLLRAAHPETDRWTAYRALLPSRAVEQRTGFARVDRMSALGPLLSELAYRWKELHFFGPIVGYQSEAPRVLDIYGKTAQRALGAHIKDSVGLLWKLRMQKEPREIEKIARATDITVAGHIDAMRKVRPGMHEWELKQIVEDAFRRGGARRLAYGSIVGAGPDGCVLHYPNDDRVIDDGELVLVDAGAEYDHYATDVTRTFPANGKFTPEQRKMYEVVLRAQKAALAKVRPGVTLDELNEAAGKVIADAGYYDYFIHHIGHHVGLDVHDGGGWFQTAEVPIAENSVITVEPGIYMPGKRIGIRIEDTVLVTRDGPKILSDKVPKDPDEIERLMGNRR